MKSLGLDTGFYKERTFYRDGGTRPVTLAKDLRHVGVEDLKDVETVVHMAELSNDPGWPTGAERHLRTNHKGSVHLAELARKAGVKGFVYMSSCSVYGVFLRNATACGASPRMRFDIVLNKLAGLAWATTEIKMTSDGTPLRPLVHGLDIARAIIAVLQAPTEAIHNEVFNVGDTSHNYRVREIAEIVGECFPDVM
jgi:nucleoside-diphosphate-sugar epimerase